MGVSPQHFLVSRDKFLGNKIIARRQRVKAGIKRKHIKISKRSRSILMKKRTRRAASSEGCSRLSPRNEVEKKVKVLKKLVPNSSDTNSLDGLFRETADYIMALQMRIKVMQFMVNGLSSVASNNNESDSIHM